MRWTPGGVSGDIEDRRGQSGGFRPAHVGIGGLLFLLLLSIIFRQDFVGLFSGAPSPAPNGNEASRSVEESPQEARLVQFVSFVLDDVQNTWDKLLPQQAGIPYRHAKLVLFRDYTQSGCGLAQSATGPFYCPDDQKVYVDLGFFDELKNQFGAPGEFAQAYVLAHEIGHHVQNLMGVADKVRNLQQRYPGQANPLSVRLELQADCLAGVWANSTAQRNLIDQSDIESGINAAAAVGDDRLQRMAQGHVSPESFTHGSAAQRAEWFRRGLSDGRVDQCNTFK